MQIYITVDDSLIIVIFRNLIHKVKSCKLYPSAVQYKLTIYLCPAQVLAMANTQDGNLGKIN